MAISSGVYWRGRGKSLQAIAGSLNGYLQVKIGPHRLNNVADEPLCLPADCPIGAARR